MGLQHVGTLNLEADDMNWEGVIWITAILLVSALFVDLPLLIFLVIVVAVNSKTEEYLIMKNIPARVEISTFATVFATINYGLMWGIFTAVFTRMFISVYTKNIAIDHIFLLGTYIFSALVADLLPFSFMIIGLITTMINNLIMFFLGKFFLGLDTGSNIILVSSNLMVNFLLFISPLCDLVSAACLG